MKYRGVDDESAVRFKVETDATISFWHPRSDSSGTIDFFTATEHGLDTTMGPDERRNAVIMLRAMEDVQEYFDHD